MVGLDQIPRSLSADRAVLLGQTLPSLLDQACDLAVNPQALNHWQHNGWESLSNHAFRTAAEELALGLLQLGLQKGDRVALLMTSDVTFCIADMGCLLAGLVDVPIDLTQTIENILHILHHSGSKVLIIANLDLLYQVMAYLGKAPDLQTIIVADLPVDWQERRSQLLVGQATRPPAADHPEDAPPTEQTTIPELACLHLPLALCEAQPDLPCPLPPLPQCIQLLSLREVQALGQPQVSLQALKQLRTQISPTDLATIVYIAGPKGVPRGVMLSHENIAANILAAFASFPDLEQGAQEVALLYLPLTHIFARTFLYGHLNYGHCIYFSSPNRVMKHLRLVQPTVFITVPRLLEKVESKLQDYGQSLQGVQRWVFDWALGLARRYELGRPPTGKYACELKLADRLIFGQWRSLFGGRLKALLSGGAALRPDLANLFSAAGIPVLQGYGLTETSAVVCYCRGADNRAGTVGTPIPGVELSIAADGEILVRAPYVMQGYYNDPAATQAAIDREGWLHTGDLGRLTPAGLLQITGIKKSLFKLATGKYVTAEPLEQRLQQSPLVAHAVAVGVQQKFCGMLIFPDFRELGRQAAAMGLDLTMPDLLRHPCILALYQSLINEANCHLPHWSTVKQFRLIPSILSLENGLLSLEHQVHRPQVMERFAQDIQALYGEADRRPKGKAMENDRSLVVAPCPDLPVDACPAFAQSLIHS